MYFLFPNFVILFMCDNMRLYSQSNPKMNNYGKQAVLQQMEFENKRYGNSQKGTD